MILTEEEAKTILCKKVPVCTSVDVAMGSGSQQRSYEEMPIFCAASSCAHWRWWDKWDNKPTPERRGYCGLSGKPENE